MHIFPSFKKTASSLASTLLGILLALSVILILFSCKKGDDDSDTSDNQAPDYSAILEITEDDMVIGNPQNPITIVEYSDLQCPACAHFHKVVKQTWRLISNDVKLVIRNYPLMQIHAQAYLAAQYTEAARVQQKHEDFFDKLFSNQTQWSEATDAEKLFLQYASEVGLDVEKLKQDKDDPAIKDKIQKDIDSGNKLGIRGTPTIFVNNKEVNFPDTPQKFFEMIQQEKQALVEAKLNK